MPETPGPFTFPTPEPQEPPSGAEILETGSGHDRIRPERRRRPRTRRRLIIGGAGVLVAGGMTAAAFGAYWYTSTGSQPAEALPATVLGYASIDLDPSGAQKLAALDVLKRLPSVSDELDLGGNPASVDVTGELLRAALADADCADVAADDVTAWLGDRAAVAALPGEGGAFPDPVVVLQVSDGDAARDGLDELAACGDLGDLDLGFDVDGEWAVVARSQDVVDRVVAERERGTLADDGDYRTWTEAAGDPGIVHLYAAPRAGEWLADLMGGEMFAPAFTATAEAQACPLPEAVTGSSATPTRREMNRAFRAWEECRAEFEADPPTDVEPPALDQMRTELEGFGGFAMTVRFDDHGVEAEMAADGAWSSAGTFVGGTGAGDALSTLPEDAAVALAVSVREGWFDEMLDYLGPSYAAMGLDVDQLVDELEGSTDLRLPEDARVLDGRTLAVALPGDFDPDAPSVDDVRVGVEIDGDPTPVVDLAGRIRAALADQGVDADAVEEQTSEDAYVLGPDADWNAALLEGGGLGDTGGFGDVLPEVDDANAAAYVDLAAVLSWFDRDGLGEDEQELLRNLEAFTRAGMASWESDGAAHGLVRLTTAE